MSNVRRARTNWPHDAPPATDLIEAARDHLSAEAGSSDAGRARWMARVSANALTVALRELESKDTDARQHALRLGRLGVADDAELAEVVRSGGFDGRHRQLAHELWEVTLAKLRVANPGYRDEALEPHRDSVSKGNQT